MRSFRVMKRCVSNDAQKVVSPSSCYNLLHRDHDKGSISQTLANRDSTMKMLCPRHVIVSIITFTLLVVGHKIASAQCSCFAQLKIRNVNIGVVPTGYNHAFWWFEVDPGNVYVVDAGPSGICPACGLLIDWIVPGNTGHYSQDNQYATSGFMATPSVTLCRS